MSDSNTAASRALDLLLHPVRVRIVQVLRGGRHLTPRQLAGALPDVPQASLYRHLNALADGGAVRVVHEHRVRNMTERVYALAEHELTVTDEQVRDLDHEDMAGMFAGFGALVIGELRRYLEHDDSGTLDLAADGVSLWQQVAYLDSEALHRISAELYTNLGHSQDHADEPDRRRRYVYFASVPAVDEPESDTPATSDDQPE